MSSDAFIEDALARLNADLQADADTAGYRLLVHESDFWLASADGSRLQAVADTARMPGWPTDMSDEAHLEHVADHLQDEVLMFLLGRVWPKCPNHRHPPRSSVVDGVAVWQCEFAESIVWRIGGPVGG